VHLGIHQLHRDVLRERRKRISVRGHKNTQKAVRGHADRHTDRDTDAHADCDAYGHGRRDAYADRNTYSHADRHAAYLSG
jgi:hypothetical protein